MSQHKLKSNKKPKKLASIEKSIKSSKRVKISSSAKALIESGKVTQWSKNPNITNIFNIFNIFKKRTPPRLYADIKRH